MTNPNELVRFNLVLNSEVGGVLCSLKWMTSTLRMFSWTQEDLYSIQHASLEAVNNAIEHGNRYNKTKKVYLSGCLSPGKVTLRIRDEGKGFDPDRIPDPTTPRRICRPRGRGLFIMRQFMSSVKYNQEKRELTLVKNLTPKE